MFCPSGPYTKVSKFVMKRPNCVRFFGVVAFIFGVLCSRGARADDEASPTRVDRHPFGVGPILGLFSGMGAMAVVQGGPVGAMVSGGYYPVFVFGNEGPERKFRANYFTSYELNADLVAGPVVHRKNVGFDLLDGYRWNTVLGHGGGAGGRLTLALSRTLQLEFLVSLNVFPSSVERLHDHGYPRAVDPALPWLQGGASAALVFYP